MDNDGWRDVEDAIHVDAYDCQQVIMINSVGVGRHVLLHLRDVKTESVYEFLLPLSVSAPLGWEMSGHSADLFHRCFPELFDTELEDDE